MERNSSYSSLNRIMSAFEIFPTPSVIPPSQKCPTVWPGISPESTAKLLEVLKDNHTRWNNFFNDQGFHKYDISKLSFWLTVTMVQSYFSPRSSHLGTGSASRCYRCRL